MWKKIWYSAYMRLFIGFCILALETIVLHAYIVPFLKRTIHIFPLVDQLIVTIIFCSSLLGSYILLYRWYERRQISELNLSSFPKDSSGGFITGFLYYSLVVGILYLSGGYSIRTVDPGIYILTSLIATCMVGVSEEILFRGIIFRLLEEKLGTWIAIFLSSFIFGFLHIWNPHATMLSSLAISVEAGFSLAAIYVLTRNLWFPTFFHVAWNFAGNTIYGIEYPFSRNLFRSEVSGPEWLTGGDFGPENTVQAVLIGFIIGVIFILAAKRKGHMIPPFWKKQKIDNPSILSGE